MEIKLFNSLTNRIDVLKPVIPGEVSIYFCGPTVYDNPHIGNMRPPIVFDVLDRFLKYVGYKVTLVSNYTDVDDKIINRSKEKGVNEIDLSNEYIKAYRKAVEGVNSNKPDITPRVTEYMDKIIHYIGELISKGAAYEIDGDVYFRISSIKDYGELSNTNIQDLLVGARIEENSKKESPLDFTLWKKTDTGISWDTKWSKGRPGWHTECCVMIDTIFGGKTIDIHGGGFDLKFPHHENEIAQAKAMHGSKIANIWMHNGFVNMGDEKMSKSLGNVVLAKDAIEKYGGNAVRLLIISTYYRAPVSFTEDAIKSSINELDKITRLLNQLSTTLQINGVNLETLKATKIEPFLEALANDLNTSNALTELFAIIKETNQTLRTRPLNLQALGEYFKTIIDMLSILGLKISYPILTKDDKKLYQDYLLAKENKDFALSDTLRNQLMQKGIL